MSLALQARNRLHDLASGGSGPAKLILTGPACNVVLDLHSIDSLAASFLEIRFERSDQLPFQSRDLRGLGDRLCAAINYLTEPLRVVESDPAHAAVQIRSDRPQDDADRKRYYEFLLSSNALYLKRYELLPGSPRREIAAVLTHEVLGRLVEDVDRLLAE